MDSWLLLFQISSVTKTCYSLSWISNPHNNTASIAIGSIEIDTLLFDINAVWFPGIKLQLYNLPKFGQARANYAPAGFVDWQAIQVDIAREAGRAWDNWEAALKIAGVGVQEFMNFMRAWKSQLPPHQNEDSSEFEDRYNQIWATIEKRFEGKLASYERWMLSDLLKTAQKIQRIMKACAILVNPSCP
jgi:hypothetical protein